MLHYDMVFFVCFYLIYTINVCCELTKITVRGITFFFIINYLFNQRVPTHQNYYINLNYFIFKKKILK